MSANETVSDATQGGLRREPGQTGPCFWLTIFATLTSSMLLLDLLGATLPRSLIYLFNPIAWLGNMIGVTDLMSGILRTADGASGQVGSFVGMPVVGSFILWILFGFFRWKRPGLAFLFLTVPWLLAMQFTTERAYESLAERFQARGQSQLEADAIVKVLFIIAASQAEDSVSTALSTRLRELE
jgi:hypothetical protein